MMQHSVIERLMKKMLFKKNVTWTVLICHHRFFNTAIYNMKDNRVLTNGPLLINDEETLLLRRQQATQSQLGSGHCKLQNSYKKRLRQTDSSSYSNCGMVPHDVPVVLVYTLP